MWRKTAFLTQADILQCAHHQSGLQAGRLLVETASVPLAGLIDGVHIAEYPLESKKLFSATFNGFHEQFNGVFDLCCLLTRTEDLVLLNCAGRTAAPVRIG